MKWKKKKGGVESFCVKIERNGLNNKYGELGKVLIIPALAVKRVGI